MCIYICICIYVYMYIYLYICVCVCVYIYIYPLSFQETRECLPSLVQMIWTSPVFRGVISF